MICACKIQQAITWALDYAEPVLSAIDFILMIWFGSEPMQFTPVVEQQLSELAHHVSEIFGVGLSVCEAGAQTGDVAHA